MKMTPVLAILRNTMTDRFHPIHFDESPLPGPPDEKKPVRHKSKGHHAEGFDTREEAIAECQQLAATTGNVRLCIENDILWDGEGVPAMVEFFDEHEPG